MYNNDMNGQQPMPMNMQQPMMNYPMLNMQQFQRVFINGDQIVNMDNIVIGVKREVYEEALNIAEEYKKVLEEHGLIEKERTPEEMAAEQAKLLNSINSSLQTILDRVDDLDGRMTNVERKGGQHGNQPTKATSDGIKADGNKPVKA